MENAAYNAIMAFVKSGQELPPKEMVGTVNLYLKPVSKGGKNQRVETIVAHRRIKVGFLAIKLIRELDEQQQTKVNDALLDIANTFVRIIKDGKEYTADIFKDGKTATKTIDRATATNYRKGVLSIDDLLNLSDI